MQWLARICVQRPVLASVLMLVILVLGTVGYRGLGVDPVSERRRARGGDHHAAPGRCARRNRD